MAVIEYKEYEHDGGFVGFRTVRTIGTEKDYRQKYFSLQDYTYTTAKRLAHELDEKWKREAEKVIKSKAKDIYKPRTKKDLHIIAEGFRAYIEVDKKIRAGELRTYYSPCFLVKVPGAGKGDLSFRPRKLGYQGAYVKAVKKYCEIHKLSSGDKLALLAKQPDKSLFTAHLLNKLRKRGYKLSKKALLEMLDIPDK